MNQAGAGGLPAVLVRAIALARLALRKLGTSAELPSALRPSPHPWEVRPDVPRSSEASLRRGKGRTGRRHTGLSRARDQNTVPSSMNVAFRSR